MILGVSLEEVANRDDLLEIGRKAIEDALIESRDARISCVGRNNGLVCKEVDGSYSHVIRFGPEEGLRIGLLAIDKHIKANGIGV